MTEAGWTAERKLVEELLTFIEATSGRKLKFSTIANLKTGETEDPQHRIAAWLKRHLDADRQQGRVEGLREAVQIGNEQSPHHLECALKWARKCEQRANEIEQAAQDEKGVGDGKV